RLPESPGRGAQAGSRVVPRSPPEHPRPAMLRARGIDASGWVVGYVAVPAPFPDVAVQVVQAEPVRGPASDRLDRIPGVVLDPGVLREQARVGPEAVGIRTTRPAGVLPLGLGRQAVAGATEDGHPLAVDPIVRPQALPFAECVAEVDGVEPGDVLHRGRVHAVKIGTGLDAHESPLLPTCATE